MTGQGGTLLVACLHQPHRFGRLSGGEWEELLAAAAGARLSGRLVAEWDRRRFGERAPGWLVDRMATIRNRCRENERAIRWEINRIARALHDVHAPWVLLKGAAYVASQLPPGTGRSVADIDVLVPEAALPEAEQAVLGAGWEFEPLDDYDTRYYREWMHELPPLVHRERRSVLDLHHGILPRTSRLRPDPDTLIARAIQVGDDGARVLCPTHMVLHAAAHLFHDGEVAGAIRDLVDLDSLLRHFPAADEAFWPTLVSDALELGLERPAYYALRYSRRVLGTPVPDKVRAEAFRWSPPRPVRALMDRLVHRAMNPKGSGDAAALALYVRSHWLKMPVRMLAPHLLRKALSRRSQAG